MRFATSYALLLTVCAALVPGSGSTSVAQSSSSDYGDLLALFADWRDFESPPLLNGAPDYTVAQFAARDDEFRALEQRLTAFGINDWPIPEQVDWYLVRAEMNGYDFNTRILKPWARDPAFYKTLWTERSDVPAHEGPTHHALVELWTYDFPLDAEAETRLAGELAVIPPLMTQARANLTGNARELWIAGIRDVRRQSVDLAELKVVVGDTAGKALLDAIDASIAATDELVAWLESEADAKTGPSGIGKDNYTWYQQNVHRVPMTWEEEVTLMERELARAWSMLKFEEQRNRELPPMVAASTPDEYDALAEDAVERIMTFLDEKDIVTIADYMEPALREHMG
ncbi:MAG: hypothetical protein WBM57_07235, partial [Woeseiaceae bacterium]